MTFNNPRERFRLVAFLEGCSYILLLFTMVLKYQFDMPKPNFIVGSLHGFLFVLYMLLLFHVSYVHKWSLMKMFLAFLISLIPFGTFYADKYWFKKW